MFCYLAARKCFTRISIEVESSFLMRAIFCSLLIFDSCILSSLPFWCKCYKNWAFKNISNIIQIVFFAKCLTFNLYNATFAEHETDMEKPNKSVFWTLKISFDTLNVQAPLIWHLIFQIYWNPCLNIKHMKFSLHQWNIILLVSLQQSWGACFLCDNAGKIVSNVIFKKMDKALKSFVPNFFCNLSITFINVNIQHLLCCNTISILI